jgi:hypothetical protein
VIDLPGIDSVFNVRLIKEPMNWAIVFVIASIWLLLFHVIMTAWQAMVSPPAQQAVGGPGQVSASSSSSGAFSTPGTLSASPPQIPGLFVGGASSSWTDGTESKYAEDGWTGAY